MKSATWLFRSFTLVLLALSLTTLGRVQTYPLPPKHYITGKIVLGLYKPYSVRSAWVFLFEGDSQKGRSLTGDDGKYYIGGLDSKEYTIVVKRGGKELFKGQVRSPENRTCNINLSSKKMQCNR